MLNARLGLMMFLQFFIWGAWYTTIAVYMSASGLETLTHWPFTVNPIAAIVAPFFLGLVADRYFATERVLAVLHLLGAACLFIAPGLISRPGAFIGMLLIYNLCYMPTLGLSNSLAFHHIRAQEKQFPLIRVFGTVGWIVAGLFISFVLGRYAGGRLPEETALPLYTAAAGSLVLAMYALTLPHTPPPARGEPVSIGSIVGLDALRALGSPSFYVFVLSALLISIPLAAYYNFTQLFLGASGVTNIAATQTLGQMSEVFFMLLMPLFFVRLGVKWMLIAGMAAWVLRYVLFALAAPTGTFSLIAAGILLHGICYDFFFVTGQIYVDKKSTAAIRGQAQGFLVLITYGVGMLIGAQLAGALYNSFLGTADTLLPEQWQSFWLVPAAFAAAVMVFFGIAFRERERQGAAAAAAAGLAAVLLVGGCSGGSGNAGDAGAASADSQQAGSSPARGDGSGVASAPDDTAGWIVLFDSTTGLDAWRGYRRTDMPAAWQVQDGTLAFTPGAGDGGDIVTREQFGDFELVLEWRISPGGNSGVFYRGLESTDYIFETAAEMQVLDNAGHADGRSPLTSAGSNFGLYPAAREVTRPIGGWNEARIVARGPHVEHWLNGVKLLEYEQGSDEWKARVADSKFAAWPGYGTAMRGHIGLQDHGDEVWFRNIRIRPLGAD
ncbi:MAG TPA: MFS transporter [Longimicrobiales bacterium]|nr:MFS transporter [Longimicrobiales bacterium]